MGSEGRSIFVTGGIGFIGAASGLALHEHDGPIVGGISVLLCGIDQNKQGFALCFSGQQSKPAYHPFLSGWHHSRHTCF